MTALFQEREIENVIADGDADPRRGVRRFENSERQILDWKMRVGGDVDKRFHD